MAQAPGCRVPERSRQSIAIALGADRDQLTFTSGATESVHLALLGTALKRQPGRLVISAVEHLPCGSCTASEAQWLAARAAVDGDGLIRLDLLETMLAPPTQLVSMIWGQSEVGGLQPVLRVAEACRQRGITFHTDATQVIPQGLISWRDHPIDLLSLSAHKLRGPRGVGLLLHRSDSVPDPLQGGGGQEAGIRSGTEPVALIAGMAEAMRGLPRFDPGRQTVPPGDPLVRSQRDGLLSLLRWMVCICWVQTAISIASPHLPADRRSPEQPLSAWPSRTARKESPAAAAVLAIQAERRTVRSLPPWGWLRPGDAPDCASHSATG